MQFGRLILIGAALAALAPVAMADTMLSGEIDTTGTLTVKPTQIVFANTDQTTTDLHYLQSPGAVTATTGSLTGFAGGSLWYVPGATSLTTNINGRYTGRSIANLTYTDPTLATPELLYQVFENGNILDIYLTHVNTPVAQGSKTVHAGLTGTGFATLNGGHQTNGNFTLTENNFFGGKSPFTAEFIIPVPPPPPPPPPPTIPEPSGLALLGTGMMGVAGFVFRKRGKIQD
jgi:hypothetical protein